MRDEPWDGAARTTPAIRGRIYRQMGCYPSGRQSDVTTLERALDWEPDPVARAVIVARLRQLGEWHLVGR